MTRGPEGAAAHRGRTGGERAARVLAELKGAFPGWVSTSRLVEREVGGPQAHSRLVELRRQGWRIETRFDDLSGQSEYRLTSLEQGEPEAKLRAGIRARITEDGVAVVEPYAEGTQATRAFSRGLAEAVEAAVTAYLQGLPAEALPLLGVEPSLTVRSADEAGVITVRAVGRHADPEPEEDWMDVLERAAKGDVA